MRKLLLAGAAGVVVAVANVAWADEAPAGRWDGWYVGLHGGAGWGTTTVDDPFGPSIYGDDIHPQMFFGGLQGGVNWQLDSDPTWVFGLEADASFADADGTNTCGAAATNLISFNCHSSPDLFATLTGRVGHAFGPEGRTLIYLKGGAALVENDVQITTNASPYLIPPPPTSLRNTQIGWTAGVGVEQALTPAWSLKAEYDYMQFGSTGMSTPFTAAFVPGPVVVGPTTTSVHENFGLVKLGLNYKIGVDSTEGWDGSSLGSYFPFHGVPSRWSFETGVRYWLSTGTFQWDVGVPPPPDLLISRLTYRGLTAQSAELFANVDMPGNLFMKATAGVGTLNDGSDHDEDWDLGGVDAYSNTISHDGDGHIAYGNVDLGYNFLTGPGFKLGAFVGYSFQEQRWDSRGCIQIATPGGGCDPAFSDQFLVGTETTRVDALRVGFAGKANLTDHFSLSTNLAYLPYAESTGRDNHLLRTFTFGADQAGTGEGVQLETELDYAFSDQFSMGLGGRYWAFWTRNSAGDSDFAGPAGHSIFFLGDRYSTERYGAFLEAAYKYDASSDSSGPMVWADNGQSDPSRWSGFYFGLHTGMGWGKTRVNDPFGTDIFAGSIATNEFLGGIQGGYNWQLPASGVVLGVEADANFGDGDGTHTCLDFSDTFVSANCNSVPDAMGSLTGRIGHIFGSSGRTLLYGKGGLALAHNDLTITTNNLFPSPQTTPTSASNTKLGWAAGFGAEQALSPAWSLKLEYEYMGFGSSDIATPASATLPGLVPVPGSSTKFDEHFQLVQVGLNYKFGADAMAGWDGTAMDAYGFPFHAVPAGWSMELGTRLWVSSGKFQWDHGVPPPADNLLSRLTYNDMTGYSAELFERLDTPINVFVKGNIGLGGLPTGEMNDEDWNIGGPIGYSNTTSHEGNGRMAYATADVGYDFLTGDSYKAGLFVGYNYFNERIDSRGCIQNASPAAGCSPPFPDFFLVGTETAYWNSLRVGLATETRLFDRFKLKTDIAYLPYAEMGGSRDNHLLRTSTLFVNQKGTGQGVQLESSLDYMFTNAFSLGIGGRYWAMWTNEAFDQFGGSAALPSPWFTGEKYSTDRFGAFLEASFKFGETSAVVAVPLPPPPGPPVPSHFIVFFGFNKCNITAEADSVLSEAASAAKTLGSANIDIVGHTDTVGSTKYNQKLSECRANAAKSNLGGKGVPAGAISASGKGETELMVQTGDGVKEPQNRRATIDLK